MPNLAEDAACARRLGTGVCVKQLTIKEEVRVTLRERVFAVPAPLGHADGSGTAAPATETNGQREDTPKLVFHSYSILSSSMLTLTDAAEPPLHRHRHGV
jgi:hypothetical protein